MKAKTFNELCRSIDWNDMAKARKTVKSLVEKKPSLWPLAVFLDALSESAVEVHGVNLNVVYPSAVKAMLITEMRRQKN